MKCIECHEEAEYVLQGCSVCKKHYDKMKPIVEMAAKLNLKMLEEIKDSESIMAKNLDPESIIRKNIEKFFDLKRKGFYCTICDKFDCDCGSSCSFKIPIDSLLKKVLGDGSQLCTKCGKPWVQHYTSLAFCYKADKDVGQDKFTSQDGGRRYD